MQIQKYIFTCSAYVATVKPVACQQPVYQASSARELAIGQDGAIVSTQALLQDGRSHLQFITVMATVGIDHGLS